MRAVLPILFLAACGEGPDPSDVVLPKDALAFGRWGQQDGLTEVDLGERTGGFSSRVRTRVHGPSQPRTSGPMEPVIWLVDAGVSIDDVFGTANHLASHGFLVLVPQLDSATSLRTHQGLVDDVKALVDAIEADAWEVDFLAEQELVEGELGLEVADGKVAVVGHGRGAKIALLAAAADDRIDAVVALDVDDGAPGNATDDPADYPSAGAVAGGLAQPVVQLGLELSRTGDRPCVEEGEGFAAIQAALPDGSLLFRLPAAGHEEVLDGCRAEGGGSCRTCVTGETPGETLAFARATVASWMGVHLRQDLGYAGWIEEDEPFDVVSGATRVAKGEPEEGGETDSGDSGS